MRGVFSLTIGVAGVVASALTLTAAKPVGRAAATGAPAAVAANDNRTPAGTYVGDTLVLRLTLTTVAWHFLGDNDPALTVAAFARTRAAAVDRYGRGASPSPLASRTACARAK